MRTGAEGTRLWTAPTAGELRRRRFCFPTAIATNLHQAETYEQVAESPPCFSFCVVRKHGAFESPTNTKRHDPTMNYASFSHNPDVGVAVMLALLMVVALLTEFASFTIQMAQKSITGHTQRFPFSFKVDNIKSAYVTDVLKIPLRNKHVTGS
jgi:hypothetical protein